MKVETGKRALPRFAFQGTLRFPEALDAVAIWFAIYLPILIVLAAALQLQAPAGFHVSGLTGALAATGAVIAIRGPFRRRPRFSIVPVVYVAVMIGLVHVILTTSSRVAVEIGDPSGIAHLLTLLVTAAAHEELLFRGIPFEALARWNREVALAISTVLFALLHGANPSIEMLASINIAAGGLFLALVRMRFGLLSAIAAHFVWNMATGPLLGYAISGWDPDASMLEAVPRDIFWSGGVFGMEGGAALSLALAATLTLFTLLHGRWRGADILPADTASREMEMK